MHVRLAALLIVISTILLSFNAPSKSAAEYDNLRATCQNSSVSSKVIVACTALLERGGESPEYQQNYFARRAEALNSHRRYQFALGDADRALALNPEYTYTLVTRVVSKNALGDRTGAMADIELAASIDPDNLFVLFNKAKLHYLLGDVNAAKQEMEHLLGIDPGYDDVGSKYMDLLYEHYPSDEFEAFLIDAEQRWADLVWPHDARVFYELSDSYDLEKALTAAAESARLKPNNDSELFVPAMIHLKIGDEAEGIKYVEAYAAKVNEIDVTNPGFLREAYRRILGYLVLRQNTEWIHRSIFYAAMGKSDLATQEIQSFLKKAGYTARKSCWISSKVLACRCLNRLGPDLSNI